MYSWFKIRLFLYEYRVSFDIIIFMILLTYMTINSHSIIYNMGEGGGVVVDLNLFKLIFDSIIIPVSVFILSRLLIKDHKFYESGTWKFFIPSVIGGIISMIVIGNCIHYGVSISLIIASWFILFILSVIKSLYDTEWD